MNIKFSAAIPFSEIRFAILHRQHMEDGSIIGCGKPMVLMKPPTPLDAKSCMYLDGTQPKDGDTLYCSSCGETPLSGLLVADDVVHVRYIRIVADFDGVKYSPRIEVLETANR